MPEQSPYPSERYRTVILGGGIHGVGVAHDLASRGWRDVLLVEKSTLGYGTSSRSTKLIHGGLRYLEHVRDYHLVAEGLKERRLLMDLAPDLVKAIPLVFPVLKKGGMPRLMIKAGLTLYDLLAGRRGIGKHYSLSRDEALNAVPGLDLSIFKHLYVFYDGQTDDLGLVQRVAKSASDLGVTIYEGTTAERIEATAEGYDVHLMTAKGPVVASARYVVNAAGPWAHEIFEKSGIVPKYEGVNSKGSHIMIEDIGLTTGVFLQSPEDGRIFFVLPWKNKTLIGTTETDYPDRPDNLRTDAADISYLIDHYNRYFTKKISQADIIATFSGLRWLAKDKSATLSDTSRSHIISQHHHGKGTIYTIYGGKLTAYRSLSEEIGDMILKDYGEDMRSRTADPAYWAKQGSWNEYEPVPNRFVGL